MLIARSSSAVAPEPPASSTAHHGAQRPAQPLRSPDDRRAATDLDPLAAVDPDLHRAVRDSYRQSMRGGAMQHQAFDDAADLLSARRSDCAPAEARRLVAQMLAYEPACHPPTATADSRHPRQLDSGPSGG